jgi:hypothetical protein
VSDGKVLAVRVRTKDEVSDALAADWLKIAPIGQRASFAAQIGVCDPKTVSKAISGEHLPEAHTILNSLVLDPAALFNTFRLFQIVAVRVQAGAADDHDVIAGLLRAATEYFERMKDNARCHQDTLALADLFVPLIPAMLSIIEEARAVRS